MQQAGFILVCSWALCINDQVQCQNLSRDSVPEERRQTPMFFDVTGRAGLNDTTSSYAAAAADVNGDGYPDLAVSHHGYVSYYLNNGDATFADPLYPGSRRRRDVHGISFVDINHDGRPDLAMTKGAQRGRGVKQNEYYLNTGSSFENLNDLPSALADSLGRGRSLTPADVNNDGLVDLIIMNSYAPERGHRVALASSRNSTHYTDLIINDTLMKAKASGIVVIDMDNDGVSEFVLQQGGPQAGAIFRKNQNDEFLDITRSLRLRTAANIRAVVPLDIDDDGDLDLFYAGGNKTFFGAELNDGRVTFRYSFYNTPRKTGFKLPVSSGYLSLAIRFEGRRLHEYLYLGKGRHPILKLPVEKIDLEADMLAGDPKVDPEKDQGGFLWRNSNDELVYEFVGRKGVLESSAGILTLDGSSGDTLSEFGLPNQKRLAYHSLYRNDGDTFTDITEQGGFTDPGNASDAIAVDFNNDGHLDIYIVNQSDFSVNKPNQLFINNGDGTFLEVSQTANAVGPDMGNGNGAVALDYDLDGDLDLFLYNGANSWPGNRGPLILLQNNLDKKNKSVLVDLIGTRSNTRAWGARLIARIDGRTIYRQKYALNGHNSTSDLPIHIGTGPIDLIDELKIFWPSGQETTLKNIPTDIILSITEGQDDFKFVPF